MPFRNAIATSVVVLAAVAGAWAGDSVRVSQRDERFSRPAVVLAVGDRIDVSNDDPFIHHIYVDAPDMKFDSGEQRPGRTVSIRFDREGDYVVQCAIHLKMRLNVSVRARRGATE